jgi:hypothetical protein
MVQSVQPLIQCIEQTLLPTLQVVSLNPHQPVVVTHLPPPWSCLGQGNYAAVFCHPRDRDRVVKVYAPGRPGIEAEAEVYRRLGPHPAYSQCFHAGDTYLVLKRLPGTTLYDCAHQGLYIPPQVIDDIDQALAYARDRGLCLARCEVGLSLALSTPAGLLRAPLGASPTRLDPRWHPV